MKVIKVIIGLLLGLFIGMMVNGSLINIGMKVFPFPNGVNFSTPEGMKAFSTLPLHYYIFPFLAHALGSLTGCLAALLVFKENAKKFVYLIGFLFFIGGVMAVNIINAPVWFDVLDLSLAYLPMAWLSLQSKLAKKT